MDGIDGGRGALLEQFTVGFVELLWLLVPSDDESSSWLINLKSFNFIVGIFN